MITVFSGPEEIVGFTSSDRKIKCLNPFLFEGI